MTLYMRHLDSGILLAITGKRYRVTQTPYYYSIEPEDANDLDAQVILDRVMNGIVKVPEERTREVLRQLQAKVQPK